MTQRQKIVEPVRKKILCLVEFVSHFYRTEKKAVWTKVREEPGKKSVKDSVFFSLLETVCHERGHTQT